MVWYLSRLSHTGALPGAPLYLISSQPSCFLSYFSSAYHQATLERRLLLNQRKERLFLEETTTVQLNYDKKHKTWEKYYRPSCLFLRKTGWITNNFDSVFPYFITSRGLDECLNEPALTEVTFARFRNSINVFKWYKVASSYKKENVLRRICEAFCNVYILPFT